MTVSLASIAKLMNAGLTTEQMATVMDVLIVELAPLEKTRALAAERQARYLKQHDNVRIPSMSDVSMTSPTQRHNDVSLAPARVEDNTLPSLTIETVRKEESKTPCNSPLTSKPLPSEPPDFAAFWRWYPKRDGSADRKGAVKAFIAALKRASIETILEGTAHFADAMAVRSKIGTEFIPQARTWLNGDRWNERYETPVHNHKPNSIAGGFAVINAAIDRQLAEAEARERDGGENPQTLPRLRQGSA